jgi:hypothetical protein
MVVKLAPMLAVWAQAGVTQLAPMAKPKRPLNQREVERFRKCCVFMVSLGANQGVKVVMVKGKLTSCKEKYRMNRIIFPECQGWFQT